MKILALIVLLLLASQPVLAQPAHTQSLKDTASQFRGSQHFDISYDRFKDQTQVTLNGLVLRANPRLEMSAYASFPGTRPYRTRSMVLSFKTWEKASRFRYHKELKVLADARTFRSTKGIWQSRQLPKPTETLVFAITLENGSDMADAALTEIRVGTVEAVLSNEHKEALRNFLSLVQPPDSSLFFSPHLGSFLLIARRLDPNFRLLH